MTGEQQQRIAAYGVIRNPEDDVLLVLASQADGSRFFLPGGGVEFGEHPEQALQRELLEETGLTLRGLSLRSVLSDLSGEDGQLHSVRLIYDGSVVNAASPLEAEVDGSTDRPAWVPIRELPTLNFAPFVRLALGLPT